MAELSLEQLIDRVGAAKVRSVIAAAKAPSAAPAESTQEEPAGPTARAEPTQEQ